ncbi:MAG: hypothetical protein MI864_06740 [Pseudomonadales bacterium]|nr:hypothetical protein [Pseudomonadales bacterium]
MTAKTAICPLAGLNVAAILKRSAQSAKKKQASGAKLEKRTGSENAWNLTIAD